MNKLAHILTIGILGLVCSCAMHVQDRNDPGDEINPWDDKTTDNDDLRNEVPGDETVDESEVCLSTEATEWSGQYSSLGVWDLRGPLNQDRQLGHVIEDLVIAEAVKMLNLPESFQDDAERAVRSVVDGAISRHINNTTTANRLLEDPFYQELTSLSAKVHVESTIDLDRIESSRYFIGREDFDSVYVPHEGTIYELDLFLLGSTWEGSFDNGILDVDEHSVDIAFSSVINAIASEVLGTDALKAFRARLIALVDCQGLVRDTLGTSYGFSFMLIQRTISTQPIVDLCNREVSGLADSLFGILDIDTGISVGGTVSATDNNCDGYADVLESDDFEGLFAVIGPAALAPRVYVSFDADREAK